MASKASIIGIVSAVMKRASNLMFIVAVLALIAIAGFGCGCGNGQPSQPTPTATAIQPTPTQTHNGSPAGLPDSYLYSIRLTDQAGLVITIDIRVKGEKTRSDYSITHPGEDTETTIFIGDGQFDWVYDPDQDQVAKYRPGAGADPAAFYSLWFTSNYYGAVTEGEVLSAMQAYCTNDSLCESVEKKGHDTVGGEPCTVFAMTSTEGTLIDHCIAAQGYPLRISLTDFGFTSTMTFTDTDLNPDILDSVFDIGAVAPGAEVIDNT